MTIQYAAATWAGPVFQQNQDALLVKERVRQRRKWIDEGTLCVDTTMALADGAAAMPCAARASNRLLRHLRDLQHTAKALDPHKLAARLQARIADEVINQPQLRDACSTLMSLDLKESHCRLWHVGDCQAYLIDDGICHRITEPQTLRGEISDEDSARQSAASIGSSLADGIAQFFEFSGLAEPPKPQVVDLRLSPGQTLVMTSDGVSDYLATTQIGSIVNAKLAASCERLMRAAANAGSDDNMSVIALRVNR